MFINEQKKQLYDITCSAIGLIIMLCVATYFGANQNTKKLLIIGAMAGSVSRMIVSAWKNRN